MTVEELLKQKDIYYYPKGNDLIIRCLNPEHEDKNPSCRVDKLIGIFHCLSCGYKGNIFNVFDIQRDRQGEEVYKLLEKIQKIRVAAKGIEIPPGSLPFNRDYRDIKAETFAKFGAFINDIEFPDRIVFPIKDITGRIAVFQGRHLFLESAKDKYINYPRGIPLFPYPQVLKPINGSIILVEGIFDMLNLWDKGLTNSATIFGVTTLKTAELVHKNLKNYKFQGVEKIYIMFDGDKAGRENSDALCTLLKSTSIFDVEQIMLEDGVDPGSLSESAVQELKNTIYE